MTGHRLVQIAAVEGAKTYPTIYARRDDGCIFKYVDCGEPGQWEAIPRVPGCEPPPDLEGTREDRVRAAVRSLNPNRPDHWTVTTGEPNIDAVQAALTDKGDFAYCSRGLIQQLMPDYTRERARSLRRESAP